MADIPYNNLDLREVITVDVDPSTTTLEELLNIAENHKHGTISVKGEGEDGEVQWGIVIVCRDKAAEMMDNLQETVDATVAKWVLSISN